MPKPLFSSFSLRTSFVLFMMLALALAVPSGASCLWAQTTKAREAVGNPAALFGGIEVGSKGVKAIIVERKQVGEEFGFQIHLEAAKNTKVIDAKGKGLSPQAQKVMEETTTAILEFYTELKHRQVPEDHIFVVGSSGVAENLDQEQQAAFVQQVQQATHKSMEFIDVEAEVGHTVHGLISPKNHNKAFLIDVGSGNTKFGYQQIDVSTGYNKTNYIYGGIKFGTGTFAKEIGKQTPNKQDYVAKARELRENLLLPLLDEELSRKSGFQNRGKVYMSGGAVWAVSTLTHPERINAPFTVLTATDIDELYEKILANFDSPNKLFELDLTALKTKKEREFAKREIDKVANAFTAQELLAGTEILKALSDSFKFKGKRIVTIRGSYAAWIFSYVSEKAAGAKA
ncbi:MAG: hypothetical protein K1Y36_24380 [Blastocatellia bacterium]|nr:hypothetical protein [Blastocatellia bacterium]